MISTVTATAPGSEFKPSRQPVLWAATVHSMGIIAGSYGLRPVMWAGAAAVLRGSGDTFLIMTARLAGVVGLGTFVAGCLHIHLRSATAQLDTSILPYTDLREVQVTAHLIAEGQIQCSSFGELGQSLDVESEPILDADGRCPCSHRHSAQCLLSLGGRGRSGRT